MDRRSFLLGSLAAPFARPHLACAEGARQESVLVADMHAHLFFFGPNTPATRPLRATMAAGNAALVAWSLVGDLPWLRRTKGGLKQKGTPNGAEALAWFHKDLKRIKEHLAEQSLKIVATPQDVDRALRGDPHVVLAVEGASFLEDDLAPLQAAYDLGVRHLQLVHYVHNAIGDFQTEPPRHNGLSAFGKEVVRECNRLGILVDLAHSSSEAVHQALAVSKAPVVSSHGSVRHTGTPSWTMTVWRARQLSLADAKAIADKGGVVGLWPLPSDVGRTPEAYADRLLEMADWLGEDHAGFGTDMNAIANPAIASYTDLQRVVRHWQRRGASAARIRKLAVENYARVLKQAMSAREA